MVHLHVGHHQLRVPRVTPSSPLAGPLGEILTRARYVLLDFDGPVCDIFAGLPAATVADRLRKLITGQGITMPAAITSSPDPIEIFTYSATVGPDLAAQIEAEMADQEQAAVSTSRPTPYVHDVVTSSRESGRPVAVVSNNADRAVRTYLELHGLDDRIDLISPPAPVPTRPCSSPAPTSSSSHHRTQRGPRRMRPHR